MANPELLLPELIAPLVRNTIFSGNIHHCIQADSTNSIALRGAALAAEHPDDTPEGAVFLAEEQTAGRGRGAHIWHSPRGSNIYCSFLLHPPMTPAEAAAIVAAARAAAKADAAREAAASDTSQTVALPPLGSFADSSTRRRVSCGSSALRTARGEPWDSTSTGLSSRTWTQK